MKSRSQTGVAGIIAVLLPAGFGALHAQVVPTTPTKFTTRGIGDSTTSGSITVRSTKPQVATRTVTHIVLGTPRQWRMVDGKSFIGKLVAFEDMVAEAGGGKQAAPAPAIPEKLTVVRDGNARFLVDAKPYVVALDRFGPDERRFIEEVRAMLAAKK